jgi:hypothetical protein
VKENVLFLCISAILGTATACGPIQSTAYLIDADVQLEAARTANAEKYAPYEWTSANLYLHKARQQVGYSEYGVAVDFAGKASKFANEAREKAMAAAAAETPSAPSKTTR